MDNIKKLFGFTTKINLKNNIHKIYINNRPEHNGFGIDFENFILTPYHVIQNNRNIIVDNNEYIVLLEIDEYDIAVLIKQNQSTSDNNISYFLKLFQEFIDTQIIKITDINDQFYNDSNNELYKQYYINDLINFKYIETRHIHLKTNLFPAIPLYVYNKIMLDVDYYGYSGCPLVCLNLYTSLLISERNDNEIIGIPFEIIYKIINTYNNNNNKFYYLPIKLNDESISQKKYKSINKDDTIMKIDDKKIIKNSIFDDYLKIYLSHDTYILLNGIKFISIQVHRIIKSKLREFTFSFCTNELKYSDLFLNYKDTQINNQILKSIEFSKMSEEYLIDCIHKKINIPNIDYDNIYNSKKIIYIKTINDPDILKKFIANNIDISNNIYILSKISKSYISNINDITKYKELNNKNFTIEIIDPKQNKIKIKI